MAHVSTVGIDPGIIHTGCVDYQIDTVRHRILVTYKVFSGVQVEEIADHVGTPGALFIEDYNPGNYQREDKKMSEALGKLKLVFPESDSVRYVDNAGINTLIPKTVLAVFGSDVFPVSTHHNDLVSAGKIALLGMLQDKHDRGYRQLISDIVGSFLAGKPWGVTKSAA